MGARESRVLRLLHGAAHGQKQQGPMETVPDSLLDPEDTLDYGDVQPAAHLDPRAISPALAGRMQHPLTRDALESPLFQDTIASLIAPARAHVQIVDSPEQIPHPSGTGFVYDGLTRYPSDVMLTRTQNPLHLEGPNGSLSAPVHEILGHVFDNNDVDPQLTSTIREGYTTALRNDPTSYATVNPDEYVAEVMNQALNGVRKGTDPRRVAEVDRAYPGLLAAYNWIRDQPIYSGRPNERMVRGLSRAAGMPFVHERGPASPPDAYAEIHQMEDPPTITPQMAGALQHRPTVADRMRAAAAGTHPMPNDATSVHVRRR